MALIELKEVSRIYESLGVPVRAVDRVSLSVESGEFVCIAGPSGSGKTTLLNLMSCLDSPSEGSVLVNGEVLGSMSKTKAAKLRLHSIGFVFQSHNLIPVLTALENVEYVLLLKGVSARERRERAGAALDSVGLRDHLHKFPRQLSGGQQQRVAVARAIVDRVPIVFADEPTASIDSVSGKALAGLLYKLNEERGVTFIFSSHDRIIIDRAKRVVTVHDGRIESDIRR